MLKDHALQKIPQLLAFTAVLLSSACGGGSSDDAQVNEESTENPVALTQPNILLIISDDQGIDASAQYMLSNDLPTTPVIDALAEKGLVFDNAWATPGCTTTRCSIITGKYGVRTGVTAIGDRMPDDETTLQQYLLDTPATADYRSAIVGKWHLGGGNAGASEPNDFGVSYYAGILSGGVDDYENWTLTEQGQSTVTTEYATTKLTDLAIDWIDDQEANPWFMWLAYNAPHTPFHLPPAALHTANLSGTATDINDNPRAYFLAAIEAMDTEIGRLLDSLPADVRENTVIMFVGDNGTTSRARDQAVFPNRTKGTLSEGGVRVPMVVSGHGVTRESEREGALINITDFFATIADLSGAGVEEINDSVSFKSLLSASDLAHREYIYTDFDDDVNPGYTIRDARYKYIEYEDGSEALYDLLSDPSEGNDLIGSNADSDAEANRLRAQAQAIRN